jgi:hypothetical protein
VCSDADRRRLAQLPLLRGGLVEAQFMQQVIEVREFARRHGARRDLAADARYPAHDACVEIRAAAHGVVHAATPLDQAGQDVVDVREREGIVGTEIRAGPLGARALAVPQGVVRVTLVAKQHEFAVAAPGQ